MSDFLGDSGFLQELNKHRVKVYSAAIMILDYSTERPLSLLEGYVISGTMSLSASSNTRRTGSMQVVFQKSTFDLTNNDNLIAVNKKFALSIGVNNPFYTQGTGHEYFKYGDVLWFKQGTFLITGASSSISTSTCTVSMQFIDKMGMLNGVCGGTLPSAVSLHDRVEIDDEGNQTVSYPLIRQIIQETVHHFGNELVSNIIISDVPTTGRRVIQWNGSSPIYFANSGTSIGVSFISTSNPTAQNLIDFPNAYYKGEDIGYMMTDLTYPGELVMDAGSTVTDILDEIVDTLGNYEYFYDVDGYFHFQQIRNFEATGLTPISEGYSGSDGTPYNISTDIVDEITFRDRYFPKFNGDQYLNEFANTDLVASVSYSPKYSEIKNDFTVWGSRQTADDSDRVVHYHLAIDSRPKKDETTNLCYKYIYLIKETETEKLIKYVAQDNYSPPSVNFGQTAELYSSSIGSKPFEWREELYRRALIAYSTSTQGSFYDIELMAEWRNIYDVDNEEFQRRWEEQYPITGGSTVAPWTGYNVDVVVAPQNLNYWLDIIDDTSGIGQYSVEKIGRRSVVKENSKINEVMSKEVPDIVFIDGSILDDDKLIEAMKEQISIGQKYCVVQSEMIPCFLYRNSFGSCYEDVRLLLQQHLMYNAQVSLSTIPVLYLDVNQVLRLSFPELGVAGNFIISTLSWNLGGNPQMQISAYEAVVIT